MATRRRTPGSQASLRESNRARIIEAIKKHGGLTQVELAAVTGLSAASVSNIVRELVGEEIFRTAPSIRNGRRATLVSFSRGTGLVAGIHFARRRLQAVICDVNNTMLAEQSMPLAREHRADSELDRVALLLSDMLTGLDSSYEDLVGVGIAVSAPLRSDIGQVAGSQLMRGWAGVAIADVTERRFRTPVYLDNASNMAALAELRTGAGRGKENIAYLDIGEGIGSGIILAGSLIRGHHGLAGEFGHTVLAEDGPICRCGRRGCLEALAGGPAVIASIETRGSLLLSDVVVGAMRNDQRCVRAIGTAGHHIGVAAGNLCNLLDPERVVVGGELARSGEILLGPLRQALEESALAGSRLAPEVVQGQLGLAASAKGAALNAIERTRVRPVV